MDELQLAQNKHIHPVSSFHGFLRVSCDTYIQQATYKLFPRCVKLETRYFLIRILTGLHYSLSNRTHFHKSKIIPNGFQQEELVKYLREAHVCFPKHKHWKIWWNFTQYWRQLKPLILTHQIWCRKVQCTAEKQFESHCDQILYPPSILVIAWLRYTLV